MRTETSSRPIIVRVTAGLGNQLFQCACGMHMAQLHQRPVFFDSSWFDYFQVHEPRRVYQLPRLGLVGEGSEYAAGIGRWAAGLAVANRPAIRRAAQGLFRALGMHFINEEAPALCARTDELYAPLPAGPVFLNGYWQTFDHAGAVRAAIRETLFSRWKFSPGAGVWRSRIRSGQAVFIHIRRGDYQRFGLPLLREAYYAKAMEHMRDALPDPVYFVFAEDPGSVRDELSFPENVHFVEYESPHRDIEDLLLMAECAGGVLANSSFSWWGAALCGQNAQVIVPPFWLQPDARIPANLVMPGWTVADPV